MKKKIGIFTADLMTPGGSSRKGSLMAERLSRHHEVWLISRDEADTQTLARNFGVSLPNVRLVRLSVPTGMLWTVLKRLLPKHYWDIVEQFAAYGQLRRLRLDLFILNTSFHYLKCPAPRGLFMCMFPWPTPTFPRASWCRLPVIRQGIEYALANTLNRDPGAVDSYDVITANSEFTASWIKRRWNRDARVVYSASELVPTSYASVKEKVILTVGRYNDDKQLHLLIDAFRNMGELHDAGWQLHLVGKVHSGSRPYHERLVASAHGLPVVFHYDAPLDALRLLYARSAILWHAKGFGVPDDEPHRKEHFGNTPLEAMSAGCVPIVVDAGGLRETVQHGVNGFRWASIEEMQQQTLRLVRDPALLAQMGARAVQVDPRFGVEPYLRAVEDIVAHVLAR